MLKSEIIKLIGTPFELGGRGPDTFDCYGLVAHIFALQGKKVPDYRHPTDAKMIAATIRVGLQLWTPCQMKEGAVVVFRVPQALHVGYMIEHDRFVHTWERSGGVLIERISDWQNRIIGTYEYIA